MKVTEDAIAKVVSDASSQLQNPQYISSQVDELVALQPAIMHYVVAHKDDLSVESIVQVLFQTALIQRSVTAAAGKMPPLVDFKQLDAAASTAPSLEALAEQEPDVASFIHSNLDFANDGAERDVAAKLLAHIAKALLG